ncbi:MAG: NUDIX domain-containing protein [Candidatus Heimdallarchaeota archaeon]|nr:NUDIX domain-containing protein [Candidatus Heimdallarchaeota archaeon]
MTDIMGKILQLSIETQETRDMILKMKSKWKRKKVRKKNQRKNTKKSQEIDQISAGGVVFRVKGDKVQVALIRDQNTHNWILPKGQIEEGESLEDTSLRETKEETGLKSLQLIKKVGKTYYWFKTKQKEKFNKEVHFYLYREQNGEEELKVEKGKFDKGKWFSKREAMSKIGFINQRKILYKAFKMIEERLNQPNNENN